MTCLLSTVAIGLQMVFILTSSQLYDCEVVVGKNLAWFSIDNITNRASSVNSGYSEIYSNSSIAVYDTKHNLQTYGTYELAASPNGTHCYMIQTLNGNNDTNTNTKLKTSVNEKGGYQQCSTFSITKDLQSLVVCTVGGYWCDEFCNPAMTYYTSWTTAWILNSLELDEKED